MRRTDIGESVDYADAYNGNWKYPDEGEPIILESRAKKEPERKTSSIKASTKHSNQLWTKSKIILLAVSIIIAVHILLLNALNL